jgi:hypothetical protein
MGQCLRIPQAITLRHSETRRPRLYHAVCPTLRFGVYRFQSSPLTSFLMFLYANWSGLVVLLMLSDDCFHRFPYGRACTFESPPSIWVMLTVEDICPPVPPSALRHSTDKRLEPRQPQHPSPGYPAPAFRQARDRPNPIHSDRRATTVRLPPKR